MIINPFGLNNDNNDNYNNNNNNNNNMDNSAQNGLSLIFMHQMISLILRDTVNLIFHSLVDDAMLLGIVLEVPSQ